jgi:hypothetical protein
MYADGLMIEALTSKGIADFAGASAFAGPGKRISALEKV